MSHAYTTIEVAKLTGFSVRQLDYWALRGLVVPGMQQSHGPGTRKLYSISNLVQLQLVRQLKRHGWSTQKIRQAIDILRDIMNDSDPLKHAILINGNNTIFALFKTKEGERITLDALNVGGQQVMGIVLEMLVEETQKIAEGVGIPVLVEETAK